MTATNATADSLTPHLQAIEDMIGTSRLQEAAARLNALSAIAPNDARVYLAGMRLAQASGNLGGAVDAARRAVAVMPGWSVAVTELALALARAGAVEEAVATAQRAYNLEPHNPALVARLIDVAHTCNRLGLAVELLQAALALTPGQRHLQHLLARDLALLGRHAQAREVHATLLASDPDDDVARMGLLQAALALGDMPAAQEQAAALVARAPEDEDFRFWSELAHGRTPERHGAKALAKYFDPVAPGWDQHTVAQQKYKLPKIVAERVLAWYPDRKLHVLDLGCGTGLLGVCLGRIDGFLVGVDGSRGMIGQAARHGLYDRFHDVDLFEAVAATPDALYDVIAALDVFPYAGEPGAVCTDAHRVLRPGGRLVMSFEAAAADEPPLVLRGTRRYAHHQARIETLCREAGFAQVEAEPMRLRYEGTEPVMGFLVTATKAA